jgi:hypothetical protein
MDVSIDIPIDFEKASSKWMLNKFKTSKKTYKYYCKYPKCIGYRMIYPKNNVNYNLNIYSNYCTKHTNKYDNYKINKKINSKINTNLTFKIKTNRKSSLIKYNNLDEINLDTDEINLDTDEINLDTDEINLDTDEINLDNL